MPSPALSGVSKALESQATQTFPMRKTFGPPSLVQFSFTDSWHSYLPPSLVLLLLRRHGPPDLRISVHPRMAQHLLLEGHRDRRDPIWDLGVLRARWRVLQGHVGLRT